MKEPEPAPAPPPPAVSANIFGSFDSPAEAPPPVPEPSQAVAALTSNIGKISIRGVEREGRAPRAGGGGVSLSKLPTPGLPTPAASGAVMAAPPAASGGETIRSPCTSPLPWPTSSNHMTLHRPSAQFDERPHHPIQSISSRSPSLDALIGLVDGYFILVSPSHPISQAWMICSV